MNNQWIQNLKKRWRIFVVATLAGGMLAVGWEFSSFASTHKFLGLLQLSRFGSITSGSSEFLANYEDVRNFVTSFFSAKDSHGFFVRRLQRPLYTNNFLKLEVWGDKPKADDYYKEIESALRKQFSSQLGEIKSDLQKRLGLLDQKIAEQNRLTSRLTSLALNENDSTLALLTHLERRALEKDSKDLLERRDSLSALTASYNSTDFRIIGVVPLPRDSMELATAFFYGAIFSFATAALVLTALQKLHENRS